MKHLLAINQIGEEPAERLLLSFLGLEQVMETAGFRMRGLDVDTAHCGQPLYAPATVRPSNLHKGPNRGGGVFVADRREDELAQD